VEFGVAEPAAWQLLCEWNQTHCQPPWNQRELRHKLADAFRCTSPKAHFTRPASFASSCRRSGPPLWGEKRLYLPPLHSGTTAELAQLAELRGLSREGVALADAKGLLRFGEYRGHPAWFIVGGSGRVAQARRLDGIVWPGNVKALTLSGSQGAWPVGIDEAAHLPAVALVEGGPDLLAACAILFAERRVADCAPVAVLGGAARIHPEALPLFAGKRVRIFPHNDATGKDAAKRWAVQIGELGASVDAFRLDGLRRVDGSPVNDLCDLAAIHPDDFETDLSLLTILP